jgi:NADPH:quinone reductase-like Zn-dependent oxidoreductase
LGLQVINIVRREQAAARNEGGHWLVDEGSDPQALRAQVRGFTGDAPVMLGLDALGGNATAALAACLSEGGRLRVYGLLSGQPSQIAAHDLIFRDIELRGFWLARWFGDPAHKQASREVYPALMELARQGVLHMSVEQVYGLDDIAQALAHAAREGRSGKILLRGAHGTP